MRTNDNWHLIRNDNGEWISEEYAVFVSKLEASVLQSRAIRQKVPLSIQHGPDGLLWCYRHEIEAINRIVPPIKSRNLRIRKSPPKL